MVMTVCIKRVVMVEMMVEMKQIRDMALVIIIRLISVEIKSLPNLS